MVLRALPSTAPRSHRFIRNIRITIRYSVFLVAHTIASRGKAEPEIRLSLTGIGVMNQIQDAVPVLQIAEPFWLQENYTITIAPRIAKGKVIAGVLRRVPRSQLAITPATLTM